MRKTICLMIFGWILAGCGELGTAPPTATAVPSPTLELTKTEPKLIAEIKLETQTGTAYTLSWSPDGKTLAAASGGEITLISEDLKEIQAVLKPEGGTLGVTWKSDQTQFATVNGFRNPTVTIWDWDSKDDQLTQSQQIQAGADQYGVAWSPNRKMLATLAGDSKSVIQIWDTSTWQEINTFDLLYTSPRRALNWSADSSKLYSAGESKGQVVVFALNITDGNVQELGKFSVQEAEVFAVSPDAKRIVFSDAQGIAQILDIATGEILTGFKSVDQPVDMACNPNGMTLAILSYETALQLWEIPQ